ncbi:SPOR domain-containing protein [Chitinibacter sp. ZOR0017]|uniref:SPOR domain-containing protein n=1 Tax=Chitinibacter sp. ZOR0017 TaxID=1339254 RepID=UPI0006485FE9|nr:SPOR domain-containing protein [Chitinibacter sp. ZOR0017]
MANVSDELLQLRKRARRRLVGAIALVVFALTVLWTALDGEPPKSLLEQQTVEIISSAPALSSVVSLNSPQPASSQAASAVVAEASTAIEAEPLPVEPIADASRVAPVALPGKLVTHQENAPKAVEPAQPVEVVKAPSPKPSAKPAPTPKPTAKPTPLSTKKPQATKAPAADPKAILEGGGLPPASSSSDKIYYIQIGAFADAEKAAQTVKKLKDAGIPARSEVVTTSKGELTRVRIGPGNDEAKAKVWLKRLESLGVQGTLVSKPAP